MANKLRKCRQCGERKPVDDGVITPLAFFCCHDHAISFARAKTQKNWEREQRSRLASQVRDQKEARKLERQRKIDAKPLSYFREKAKIACHAYIRARDDGMPCPCCGTAEAAQWDASHYRPAGVNSALKYDERNIHRGCQVCNQHKSGNLTPFRIWMVHKFGEEFVQELDNNHEIRRYTRAELEEIEAHYKAKLSELKKSKAA